MTTDRINALMDETRAKAEARGLAVRCPQCNAGIMKWCKNGDQIVTHEARVALATAK